MVHGRIARLEESFRKRIHHAHGISNFFSSSIFIRGSGTPHLYPGKVLSAEAVRIGLSGGVATPPPKGEGPGGVGKRLQKSAVIVCNRAGVP